MIEITNVSKSFKEKTVLKNISLRVNSGEIICLLGPSGAGKTTLIRLITGALKTDSGDIRINERKAPSRELYAQMGFMPQSNALYNDLTGLENLMFYGGLYGLQRQLLKAKALNMLALLNLSDEKNKLVAHYSGGMKKRLSLAAALLHEPSFLLLDEPTVGMEPLLRRKIWAELTKLRDGGTSMIVSTHVMDEALKCDRTALLYNGSLVACDTPGNLTAKTKNGKIEELFFMAKETQL